MLFNLPNLAWLPVLDAITKATVLLAGAALCSTLLRRRSAAARHLVWTLALLSALVLPVLSFALPRWHVPVLTLAAQSPSSYDAASGPASSPTPVKRSEITGEAPHSATLPQAILPTASETMPSRPAVSLPTLLFAVWLAGATIVLLRLALGLLAVYWLARRTERAHDAPWLTLACRLAADVGVSSDVRFLRSSRATMPIACGIVRPAIVMPADADTWPAERLRIVLLHELAHVKRRDCLTHILAQMACALYWFNPLAWVAARHLRTERERACDDLVLAAGTRGPDYADQLLEIARVMRPGRFPTVLAGASLAMAYRSQLEGRLMAILDPKVPRSGITRVRAAAMSIAFACALLPLASVQPWAYSSEDGKPDPMSAVRAAEASAPAPQTESPRPTPAPTPTPAPSSSGGRHEQDVIQGMVQGTTQGMVQGMTQGVVQGMVQGMTQGTIQAMAQGPGQGIAAAAPSVEDEEEREAGEQERKTAKGADSKTVAALTAALKDTDKDVRQTALQALVQLRDPSIYDALIEALRDSFADVRQQAAFGLGELRDRRAVPALIGALKDSADDVRQQAVFALGQLRDPAAVEALAGAVRDAKPDVRQQAVFALGQIRDRRAVEPLISALKDSDADVRQQAAFALGQLRDRAAVEALVIALKDSDADVRQQAAFALGQLGDPRAIDGLTAALKDPSADVRQQAAFALGQLAR